ncbi:zinc ribbon domain-containing protein [Acetobacterium sp.]|uniref:zinc ribbon domain-containing protein n=1 Tax=Acetobacterium sp. TaxID=1872094 RepID=UPI002F3E302A
MFCENCGKKIPDDAVFCTHCGAKQSESTVKAQSTDRVQNPQPARRVDLPPVEKVERPKNPSQSVKVDGDVDLISMGQYIIMFLITAIPIAGIVMLFVWGFSSETGPNKKNFSRAYLIMMAIAFGAGIILSIVMGAIMASMMSSLYY